jgi:hypothetical protein
MVAMLAIGGDWRRLLAMLVMGGYTSP